ESLVLLRTSNESWEPEEEYLREVLGVVSKRWCVRIPVDELGILTDRVLEISGIASNPETRVVALATAVRLLSLSQDRTRISLLIARIQSCNDLELDPYQRLHVILAEAWSSASGRGLQSALDYLQKGLGIARRNGYMSTIVIRLYLGEGNVLALLGRYGEALAPLMMAAELSTKLDNSEFVAEAFSLLAMVNARIGEHTAQMDCARKALSHQQEQSWGPSTIGATYELAMALACTGREGEATATIDMLTAAMHENSPAWGKQAVMLNAADVYWVAGKNKSALRHAGLALRIGGGLALHESLQGQFTRWSTMLELCSGKAQRALQRLSATQSEFHRLDAKDQVELLAARGLLLGAIGEDTGEVRDAVLKRLESLPDGIARGLTRFGFHPSTWSKVGRSGRTTLP
ncbi:MAG: hypothetical protein ABI542_07725, partial [Gemmatimonadota bacterium]